MLAKSAPRPQFRLTQPPEAPYLKSDFERAVQVVEGGDTVWALWQQAEQQAAQPAFANTVPLANVMADAGDTLPATFSTTARLGLPAEMDTEPDMLDFGWSVERVLLTTRIEGRLGLGRVAWREFYQLLGGEAAAERGLRVPPLGLEQWQSTSILEKRVCLREQVQWASSHGLLGIAAAFLERLPAEAWLRQDEGCYV